MTFMNDRALVYVHRNFIVLFEIVMKLRALVYTRLILKTIHTLWLALVVLEKKSFVYKYH